MIDVKMKAENKTETVKAKKVQLTEFALGLLDYKTVLDQVVAQTRFFAARSIAESMRPIYASSDVEVLQDETTQGIVVIEKVGDIDLYCDIDPTELINRAEIGGVLSGQELLAVADVLKVLERARVAISVPNNPMSHIAALCCEIPDLQQFQRRIRRSVGKMGVVLDSASSNLGSIRRQVRHAYQNASDALEKLIKVPLNTEALQDDVISMRGNRLVVQVKAEMRSRIPGIVHDASNTGSTLFVEPFITIELCNAWRELGLEEEREKDRVLRRLSKIVGDIAQKIREGIELTARIDYILARARYSKAVGGVSINHQRSTDGSAGLSESVVNLSNARHPVLGEKAVPINVSIGPDWHVLVITGPNTGGKTLAMKTVGLLALLYQSGIRIPVDEESTLPVFDGIYADVGDSQSIEYAVSRFGAHMQNVIDILSVAGRRSLVLLDELGTSTDSEEGSALAKAILEHLAVEGIATVATTHHRTVAAHAETTKGMTNASVEFDSSTMLPTYHLTIGEPGRSYALVVADQLGLPEKIMEKAKSLVDPDHFRFEKWLSELQNDRQIMEQQIEEANKARQNAEAYEKECGLLLQELTLRREEIVRVVRKELGDEYDSVRKKLRRAEASLSWETSVDLDRGGSVQEAASELKIAGEKIKEIERHGSISTEISGAQSFGIGDTVDVSGLNVNGTVIGLFQDSSEVEVAIGRIKLRVDIGRISLAKKAESEMLTTEVTYNLDTLLPAQEIDLRGQYAEEALAHLEAFLDKAVRDGLNSVRIIHGKGTGALRTAVRELLGRHSLAKTFASESPKNGGDGATLVELI